MKILPISTLLLGFLLASSAASQVVPAGSTWKYLDDGSDQGTAWQSPAFDDSFWAAGPAQLGYGEGDELTEIDYGPNVDDKYRTSYFRHTFNVANPLDLNQLALGLVRDDGVVVYLNGSQIFRNNLPAGAPNYLTEATDAIDGARENKWLWKSLDPALLITGDNVLAVEIHQAAGTSSDVSFDLTLDETQLVPKGMIWRYLDDGSNQGTAWQLPSFNHSSWNKGPAELGYGDGDEQTEVSFGPNSDAKYPTTYFRGEFEVVDPLLITDLTMGLQRDDGAVIYLNGTEIARQNMDPGAVTHLTFANTTVDGAVEYAWNWSVIDPALLVVGTNVVAVEIHQANLTSSDISFDLQLKPQPMKDLIRGPYLQNGSENSVTLHWRTSQAENSMVEYGTSPQSLTQSVFDPAVSTDHEIQLTGLASGSTYYYSIGTDTQIRAGADADHQFTTFPATGQASATRVWVLGDSGTATAIQTLVRDAYYQWSANRKTDLWLLLGDNAYNDGTDDEYQTALFETYQPTLRSSVVYSTRGNHERNEGVYYDIFNLPSAGEAGGLASGSEAYYSFDYANVHFVCLDSDTSSRLVGDPMITWLENDLASTNQEWIIAYWHHPPYTKGSHNSDSPTDSDGRMTEMRERFLPVLESYGVDLVLNGHSHVYERSRLIDGHYNISLTWNPGTMLIDSGDGKESGNGAYVKPSASNAGTVYTVTGSAGKVGSGPLDHPAMYTSQELAGSVALDIDGDRLDLTFVDIDGLVADSFTMRKHHTGPFLDIRNLTAGQFSLINVTGLTPGNPTYLGYTVHGPGPSTTPLGVVSLSHPISQMGPLIADGNGEIHLSQLVPINATGLTLYSQVVEVVGPSTGLMSNARADVVQ
jgi:hypothetical protein